MKSRWIGLIVFLSFTTIFFPLALKSTPYFGGPSAWGDDDDKPQFPKDATFTTLITTPRAIEGLTGDNHRNLYTGGSGPSSGKGCPVWQINIHNPRSDSGGIRDTTTTCLHKLRLQWDCAR